MMALLNSLFISPLYLPLLGLLPVIVLLYILKLRRTEVVIPSTLLWRKSLQDLTANAPFQKLRNNILLYLQLLILLLIVLALARPFMEDEGLSGKSWCVVLDRSASMQTQEENGSRMQLAQSQALELINSLSAGDRMMVVTFAEKADVLCELTDDKFRLRQAVNSIQSSDTRSDIGDVIQIVRSLAPDNPDVASAIPDLQVLILSDGKISDPDALEQLSLPMQYLQIGTPRDNAGIITFSLRKPETAQLISGTKQNQCLVSVYNDAETALAISLSLYYHEAHQTLDESENLMAVEDVSIAPGEIQEFVFELPNLDHGLLRATLDAEDALAVDNTAWLTLQADMYIDVALVGDDSSASLYFLQRAMTIDPRVRITRINPADFNQEVSADLFIFVGYAPEILPAGTLMFSNVVPSIQGLEHKGEIDRPVVLSIERTHPLMRFLNPENVGIAKALRVNLPDGARTLCSTQDGPLIADISQAGRKILLLTFDIADTDWPVNLSFPLFVQNLLNWSPQGGIGGESAYTTGASIALLPIQEDMDSAEPRTILNARITAPNGASSNVELNPLRPVYFANTSQAGPYRVQRGNTVTWYAVNLLDQNESSVAPATSLKLGQAEIAAAQNSIRFNREFWPWLAAFALAALCLEWWIYTRRAWY